MLKYFWYSFIFLSLNSCQTKAPVLEERIPVAKIYLDSLVVKDLSEDMSRISTHQDEIFLFTFLHRQKEILQQHKTHQLVFSKETFMLPINLLIEPPEESDHCTFFLVELDNETLPPEVDSLLANWVQQSAFLKKFNFLQADSLLGHDDLLGMQSYLVRDLPKLRPLSFSGRQLFDRFVYELYLSLN